MIVIRHNPIFGNEVMMVRGDAAEYVYIRKSATNGYRENSYRVQRLYTIRPSEHPNSIVCAAEV